MPKFTKPFDTRAFDLKGWIAELEKYNKKHTDQARINITSAAKAKLSGKMLEKRCHRVVSVV